MSKTIEIKAFARSRTARGLSCAQVRCTFTACRPIDPAMAAPGGSP